MPIEPFLLIVADHDNRTFSVAGPMVDDDPWVPGGPARNNADIAAREYKREFGYAQVPAGSVVSGKLW